jgi:hypothetical protein
MPGASIRDMETRGVAEAALLGAAAGIRSMVPLATLGLTLPRRPLAYGAPVAVASAAELVYDKLPQAGERTAPGPLVARIGAGALAGGIAGYVLGTSMALTGAAGGLAALASTLLSHRARAAAARRVPPLVAALSGDLLAIGVAAVATQRLAHER